MEKKNRGGGHDLLEFYDKKAIATKLMSAKPKIETIHQVSYKQIRDDMIKQMGSLHRKRKSEIATENMRIFKKIQNINDKPSDVR